jgi:hypothetical protein
MQNGRRKGGTSRDVHNQVRCENAGAICTNGTAALARTYGSRASVAYSAL